MLHSVVMAGGSGTRFWPQSRKSLPKQLLALAGDRTMLRQTVDRCSELVNPQTTWVVTNSVQAEKSQLQLPEVPAAHVLTEPAARNTAPCIGLAAHHLLKQDPDAEMLVLPADHVITPQAKFTQAVNAARSILAADAGQLVLFGVPPTFPATGYGYIEQGEAIDVNGGDAWQVASFREKPARDLAQRYVDEGRFLWNCGIFCWKAATILGLLEKYEPEMAAGLNTIAASIDTPDYESVLNSVFPELPSVSIDYAVLERADSVRVIAAPFDWDDVGSWPAVRRLNTPDADGNVVQGDCISIDTSNCILRTGDGHLIATLGVSDLTIVHTPDVTLVARTEEAERVKELIAMLTDAGRTDLL